MVTGVANGTRTFASKVGKGLIVFGVLVMIGTEIGLGISKRL
jgi:hypothetical protein